ncbi:hypothetical protein D4764_16G0004750 [Takifugu flavidus]|uniref:Uncharacterized protein n=1 Tax=Takifugu flavidus TaxID=433684 RepID=A0A5C6NYU3_9TELE|nr:hypothetical protein D4764_16G0004750 [Takifugu flavidus]
MLLRVCILFMWFHTVKTWTSSASPRCVTDVERSSSSAEATGVILGTAALTFSILALVLILVIVLWLALHEPPSSSLASLAVGNSHSSAPPRSHFRGDPEKVGVETDVYMNYTKESYTNLDPTSMESVYSSMS